MPFYLFYWDEQNTEHIGEHGVTPDESEHVVCYPEEAMLSDSSGRPAWIGRAPDGRRLFCVWEEVDDVSVFPVTAYPSEDE